MNGLIKWVVPHSSRSRAGGLEREMGRLLDGLWGPGFCPAADLRVLGRSHRPEEEVAEDEDGFSLAIALPGLGAADVAVTVESGTLVVKAKGGECAEEGKGCAGYHRTFTLPETVAEEKVAALMKDGMLRVSLPKKEEAKPRRRELKIKAG